MDNIKCIQLPAGDALTWDLTTLTDEQLEYEYNLAYENLFGAEIAGLNVMKGLMVNDHTSFGVNKDDLDRARNKWLQRLKHAEDELFERQLL
jgi:hypothetical protein